MMPENSLEYRHIETQDQMKYLSSWREKNQKVNSIVATEMRCRFISTIA